MTAPSPSFGKLFGLLYLFTATAVAINLFMLGLMSQAVGFTALSPVQALVLAVPLGIPANWAVTRWVLGLIDEAEGRRK